MFSILLVDDEIQAVANVKEGIDWAALGIDQVYVAYSMKQAIEVYRNNDIDIMLCDIEMPKGNGIELLKWVRENLVDVENIFLTCHADFSYAKEAISLGSMEYLLKPVPFTTLEETIGKAINRSREKRRIASEAKQVEYWLEGKNRILEQFYLELISGQVKCEEEVIRSEATARNLEDELKTIFRFIYVDIVKYGKYVATWEKDIRFFSFKNIAEEVFASLDVDMRVLYPGEDHLLLVLSKHVADNLVEKTCSEYVLMCRRYLGSDANAYLSMDIAIEDFCVQYHELEVYARNHITKDEKVLFYKGKKDNDHRSSYTAPDKIILKALLREGRTKEIQDNLVAYFKLRSRNGDINAAFMDRFAEDFHQVLMNVLEEKHIEVSSVFPDSQIRDFYMGVGKSLEVCLEMTTQMVETATQEIRAREHTETRVEKAKQYIIKNLDQDISRESVAAYVYLNPDYLNKLFKKEVGMTVSDFIYTQRMVMAEKLLLSTDYSIREIAMQVGYGNFSHFAKMFSRYAGKTPKAYKKSMSR